MKGKIIYLILSLFVLSGCRSNDYVISSSDKTENNPSEILVDIKGAVKYPGVYTIFSTALVKDIVTMAGGFLENADTSELNLVREITANEMLVIPFKSDAMRNSKININNATKEDLMTLPGIGMAKANAIIEYRTKNGYFSKIEDIEKVAGISETIFNQIKTFITIS